MVAVPISISAGLFRYTRIANIEQPTIKAKGATTFIKKFTLSFLKSISKLPNIATLNTAYTYQRRIIELVM